VRLLCADERLLRPKRFEQLAQRGRLTGDGLHLRLGLVDCDAVAPVEGQDALALGLFLGELGDDLVAAVLVAGRLLHPLAELALRVGELLIGVEDVGSARLPDGLFPFGAAIARPRQRCSGMGCMTAFPPLQM